VTEGIEDCRKACGGNGYLLNSGVAANAADYVWQTTAEGDYILLMLLTGRFLLKMLRNAKEGKPVSGPVAYLSPLKDANFEVLQAAPKPAADSAQWENHQYLLSWYSYRALYLVNKVGTKFATLTMTGAPFMEAWNECSLELVEAVRGHCFYVLLSHFDNTVKTIENQPVKKVMSEICSFFALSQLMDQPSNGLIGADQIELIKEAAFSLLNRLRPNCVTLVDSFDIPDRVLNSTLGSYDGNVYEKLYESARRSTLNLKDPFEGYHEYLRPRLDLEFLKRGNKVPSKL